MTWLQDPVAQFPPNAERTMAETVDEYIAALPDARREVVQAVRQVILDNLPAGYEEGIQYGSIGYYVPHSICPEGYHCDAKQPVPFAGLANGKAKISLHMFGLYVNRPAVEAFATAWKAAGKKLDMGASCVRFKKLADVPLDVVAQTIASLPLDEFLANYEAGLNEKAKKQRAKQRAAR
jgi:uncharacterized protein YdhG (YjbR/CyaY superfamily)